MTRRQWQAVLSKDARFDGQFVFAVSSTGIYCRPSCPSRRPRREHVSFFQLPEAAEQAGFRACLRCHPRDASVDGSAGAKWRDGFVASLKRMKVRPMTLAALSEQTRRQFFSSAANFQEASWASRRRQYAETCAGEAVQAEACAREKQLRPRCMTPALVRAAGSTKTRRLNWA